MILFRSNVFLGLIGAAALLSGCQLPGLTRSDVSALTTEDTGWFEITDRELAERAVRLHVRAANPERAELIAEKLIYQQKPLFRKRIDVVVSGLEGGQARTITWTSDTEIPAPAEGHTSPDHEEPAQGPQSPRAH